MNTNEPCNVKVTFSDGRAVVIENLSLQQQRCLSELLQASGVRYHWAARFVGRPSIGERTGYLWRRILQWLQPLIIFALLSMTTYAQDLKSKPRAIEPIKIEITAQGEEPHSAELDRLIREDLQKTRIVIVSRRARTAIHLAVAEITSKGQRTGFASALLMLDDGDVAYLSVFIEPDLQNLARKMAEFLKQELTTKKER